MNLDEILKKETEKQKKMSISKDEKTHERISSGMIVARTGEVRPIFGNVIPYKSVTVICNKEQCEEVEYWLNYLHGGGTSRRKEI